VTFHFFSDININIALSIFLLQSVLSAVPRPLRLERILSVISCIGVGSLVLTGASKVQNDYFGSHLFRRPEEMKICLVEGTVVPAIASFGHLLFDLLIAFLFFAILFFAVK
jgi:hypothetical protein